MVGCMYTRIAKIELPPRRSTFLWGARQIGKSSFLKANFPNSIYYDLLDTKEIIRLTKEPYLLREEIESLNAKQISQPIIIDEIQKVPELLNEVHWLIENTSAKFILCGSSARQLKTKFTNLLGGRAWIHTFFPLTFIEITDFNLLKALQHGMLPRHYLEEPQYIDDTLQSYVNTYLTEEVKNEGLVRNLQGFASFLDLVGMNNGEMININNIARDCGVSRSTVQGYYQILIDTLLGYYLQPFKSKRKRDIILSTPKFYLFDIGVANYLAQNSVKSLKSSIAGKSFEHFILMELKAYIGLRRKNTDINYWRTKTGLEVDFIIPKFRLALEVKISPQVHQSDLKGLIAFCLEHPEYKPIVIAQVQRKRICTVENINIKILPWHEFLTDLWENKILN